MVEELYKNHIVNHGYTKNRSIIITLYCLWWRWPLNLISLAC